MNYPVFAMISAVLAAVLCGCSSNSTEHDGVSTRRTESRGEHDRDGGEHDREGEGHREEGEESGTELTLSQSYDKVRNGVRLVMAYDAQSNAFKGTVVPTYKPQPITGTQSSTGNTTIVVPMVSDD